MEDSETPSLPSVDLAFRPQLDQVSAVREFLEGYYKLAIDDLDLVSRMAIAAHELLENAAKYSAGGLSHLRVAAKNGAGPPLLAVSVSSVPLPEHIEDLKLTVKELAETTDPAVLYIAYLARAAKRNEGSGLGLARIRAEADMTLSVDLHEGRIHVEALARLPQPQPQPRGER
jgi:hypothetical protein